MSVSNYITIKLTTMTTTMYAKPSNYRLYRGLANNIVPIRPENQYSKIQNPHNQSNIPKLMIIAIRK